MRQKPKLPRGWSWPLTATEVQHRFPQAARIEWTELQHRPHEQEYIVLRAHWEPSSMAATPDLYVCAVPSVHRHAIRAALEGALGDEVASWFSTLAERPDTWRSERHAADWRWAPPPNGG